MRLALCGAMCMLVGALVFTIAPAVFSAQDVSADGEVIVDHVILGISDLEEGIKQLEALTGVRAVIGGEHPGRGTRNALISLGSGHYLELLAPVPGGVIDEFDDLAGDLETFSELTPVGWAASSGNMDDLAEKLVAEGYEIEGPVPGSRVKPDGSVLEWRSLVISNPLLAGAPFFIEWSRTSVHPSESSPQGCELELVRLEDPDAMPLRDLVSVLGLPIRVESGVNPAIEIALNCPRGVVRFSSGGSGR